MSETEPAYDTTPIEPDDVRAGFSCGVHALDDFFTRHARANDAAGIGRVYVMRRGSSAPLAAVLAKQLPTYPMPVALIGRLAVDKRAHGRRLGEKLLIDGLRRVVDAATIVGCTGIIVDAKDEGAARFYAKYDFVAVTDEDWPRRMFLPNSTARAALAP